MENILTIALITRLKRKIFTDVEVQEDAEQLVRKNIGKLGIEPIEIKFEDHGMILVLNNPDHTASDTIASYIRNVTSAPIRSRHEKLQKMPSLWSKKFFCESGNMSAETYNKILKFLT